MATATRHPSIGWSAVDRALLIAIVLAYIPGIPGVGVETRPPSPSGDALVPVFTVAGLAPLVALAASWRWPTAAAWIAVLAGALAVVLAGLDFAGVYGQPPPPGMVVVDAVFGMLGLALVLRGWRLARSGTG